MSNKASGNQSKAPHMKIVQPRTAAGDQDIFSSAKNSADDIFASPVDNPIAEEIFGSASHQIGSTQTDTNRLSRRPSQGESLFPNSAKSNFNCGDIVWAKVDQRFPYWPALVMEYNRLPDEIQRTLPHANKNSENSATASSKKKVLVYLYGRNDFELVSPSNMFDFMRNFNSYSKRSVQANLTTTFKTAIKLAEEDIKKAPENRAAWLSNEGWTPSSGISPKSRNPASNQSFTFNTSTSSMQPTELDFVKSKSSDNTDISTIENPETAYSPKETITSVAESSSASDFFASEITMDQFTSNNLDHEKVIDIQTESLPVDLNEQIDGNQISQVDDPESDHVVQEEHLAHETIENISAVEVLITEDDSNAVVDTKPEQKEINTSEIQQNNSDVEHLSENNTIKTDNEMSIVEQSNHSAEEIIAEEKDMTPLSNNHCEENVSIELEEPIDSLTVCSAEVDNETAHDLTPANFDVDVEGVNDAQAPLVQEDIQQGNSLSQQLEKKESSHTEYSQHQPSDTKEEVVIDSSTSAAAEIVVSINEGQEEKLAEEKLAEEKRSDDLPAEIFKLPVDSKTSKKKIVAVASSDASSLFGGSSNSFNAAITPTTTTTATATNIELFAEPPQSNDPFSALQPPPVSTIKNTTEKKQSSESEDAALSSMSTSKPLITAPNNTVKFRGKAAVVSNASPFDSGANSLFGNKSNDVSSLFDKSPAIKQHKTIAATNKLPDASSLFSSNQPAASDLFSSNTPAQKPVPASTRPADQFPGAVTSAAVNKPTDIFIEQKLSSRSPVPQNKKALEASSLFDSIPANRPTIGQNSNSTSKPNNAFDLFQGSAPTTAITPNDANFPPVPPGVKYQSAAPNTTQPSPATNANKLSVKHPQPHSIGMNNALMNDPNAIPTPHGFIIAPKKTNPPATTAPPAFESSGNTLPTPPTGPAIINSAPPTNKVTLSTDSIINGNDLIANKAPISMPASKTAVIEDTQNAQPPAIATAPSSTSNHSKAAVRPSPAMRSTSAPSHMQLLHQSLLSGQTTNSPDVLQRAVSSGPVNNAVVFSLPTPSTHGISAEISSNAFPLNHAATGNVVNKPLTNRYIKPASGIASFGFNGKLAVVFPDRHCYPPVYNRDMATVRVLAVGVRPSRIQVMTTVAAIEKYRPNYSTTAEDVEKLLQQIYAWRGQANATANSKSGNATNIDVDSAKKYLQQQLHSVNASSKPDSEQLLLQLLQIILDFNGKIDSFNSANQKSARIPEQEIAALLTSISANTLQNATQNKDIFNVNALVNTSTFMELLQANSAGKNLQSSSSSQENLPSLSAAETLNSDGTRSGSYLSQVELCLLLGLREEALELAVAKKDYALAILISSVVNITAYQQTIKLFAGDAFQKDSILYLLMMLYSNQASNTIQYAYNNLGGFNAGNNANNSSCNVLATRWRFFAAALISNKSDNWRELLIKLGHRLEHELQDISAAHFLYLVASILPHTLQANSTDMADSLLLIGGNALQCGMRNINNVSAIAAFRRYEILELAIKQQLVENNSNSNHPSNTSNSGGGGLFSFFSSSSSNSSNDASNNNRLINNELYSKLQSMQVAAAPLKLRLAMFLNEMGLVAEAQQYAREIQQLVSVVNNSQQANSISQPAPGAKKNNDKESISNTAPVNNNKLSKRFVRALEEFQERLHGGQTAASTAQAPVAASNAASQSNQASGFWGLSGISNIGNVLSVNNLKSFVDGPDTITPINSNSTSSNANTNAHATPPASTSAKYPPTTFPPTTSTTSTTSIMPPPASRTLQPAPYQLPGSQYPPMHSLPPTASAGHVRGPYDQEPANNDFVDVDLDNKPAQQFTFPSAYPPMPNNITILKAPAAAAPAQFNNNAYNYPVQQTSSGKGNDGWYVGSEASDSNTNNTPQNITPPQSIYNNNNNNNFNSTNPNLTNSGKNNQDPSNATSKSSTSSLFSLFSSSNTSDSSSASTAVPAASSAAAATTASTSAVSTAPASGGKSSTNSGDTSNNKSLVTSVRKGILGWLYPDAHDASENIGQSLEAYYDEKLQRWVFPGEEQDAQQNAALKPPPIAPATAATTAATSTTSSAPAAGPPSAASINNSSSSNSGGYDPLAALMAPPPMRSAAPTSNSNLDPLAALMAPPPRSFSNYSAFGGATPTANDTSNSPSTTGTAPPPMKFNVWKPPANTASNPPPSIPDNNASVAPITPIEPIQSIEPHQAILSNNNTALPSGEFVDIPIDNIHTGSNTTTVDSSASSSLASPPPMESGAEATKNYFEDQM